MKHLVIAEKPSVGRDIARVLHCNKKTNTYMKEQTISSHGRWVTLSHWLIRSNTTNSTRPGTWIRFPCSQSTGSW